MTFKEWRKTKKLSQVGACKALETYAAGVFPLKPRKKLPQRTLAYWEQGTMPRKFWLQIIVEYTAGRVTANSFLRDHVSKQK